MLNPYLETWNLCSATLGSGGGVTSGAMFGGNIGPFHAVRAVTVAKRREYSRILFFERSPLQILDI